MLGVVNVGVGGDNNRLLGAAAAAASCWFFCCTYNGGGLTGVSVAMLLLLLLLSLIDGPNPIPSNGFLAAAFCCLSLRRRKNAGKVPLSNVELKLCLLLLLRESV